MKKSDVLRKVLPLVILCIFLVSILAASVNAQAAAPGAAAPAGPGLFCDKLPDYWAEKWAYGLLD